MQRKLPLRFDGLVAPWREGVQTKGAKLGRVLEVGTGAMADFKEDIIWLKQKIWAMLCTHPDQWLFNLVD